jgi:hypothetical protein
VDEIGSQTDISLPIFIISWVGFHEKAIAIAQQVLTATPDVAIVYSDPDPELELEVPCESIRRPNDRFFEDKFKACLDRCGDGPMLVIHEDCECDDWVQLFNRCVDVSREMPNLGVWAPKIIGTHYEFESSIIMQARDSELFVAALTDAIVFCLAPEVVKRMRALSFGENQLGWGIDLMFCSSAHVMNRLVILDAGVTVQHPKSRGYDADKARALMNRFLLQATLQERISIRLLQSYVELNRRKRRGTI